jgi:hypothetical protein
MLHKKLYKTGLALIMLFHFSAADSQSLVQERETSWYDDTSQTAEQPDLSERPKNNIFLNICGDGSIASLNYERLFFAEPEHFFIAAGAGAGMNFFVTIRNDNGKPYSLENYLIIPHHATANIGMGRHFFEFGVGGAFLSGPRAQPYLPSLMAGYRLQPWNTNKLHLRVFGSYPLEGLEKFEILYIPVGLSVGWSF